MDTYRANSTISLVIPLVNDEGVTLTPISVNVRVIDEVGAEVMPNSVSEFVLGADTVSVVINQTYNTLSTGALKGMRVIELTTTAADGSTDFIQYPYILEVESGLVMMVNSYQTLNQAKLVATDMAELAAWESAKDAQLKAAMIEAYHRIGKLKFIDSGFDDWIPSINKLSAADFATLPPLFITAIRRAQVAEADAILGGDPIAKKREEGLMSDSVGQSSIMFRPGKPLALGISKQALNQLGGWVTFGMRIGR